MVNTAKPDTVSVAALIANRQAEMNVSDATLAKALGLENPALVKLIKQGRVKVPTQNIAALASALAINAPELLRIVLGEYSPVTLAVVEELLKPAVLTTNESKLIESFRCLTGGRDTAPVVVEGTGVIALVVA